MTANDMAAKLKARLSAELEALLSGMTREEIAAADVPALIDSAMERAGVRVVTEYTLHPEGADPKSRTLSMRVECKSRLEVGEE